MSVGPGHPPVQHRFQPGRSGNPGGRRKSASLTAILREIFDAELPDGRTVAERFVEAMIARAMAGDSALIREIFNRVDGKVPDAPKAPAGEVHVRISRVAAKAAMKAASDAVDGPDDEDLGEAGP